MCKTAFIINIVKSKFKIKNIYRNNFSLTDKPPDVQTIRARHSQKSNTDKQVSEVR